MAKHLNNVDLNTLRTFLKNAGCECKRISGGHEHWVKAGSPRPISFQTHIEPVPVRILKNQILKNLGLTADDFWRIVENKDKK